MHTNIWRKSIIIGTIILLISSSSIATAYKTTKTNENTRTGGNTLYVGGSGPSNYSTIQAAINTADPGDTIFVYQGTYLENIYINITLNLCGEDKNTTIIDGGGQHDVIYIGFPANSVTITGFTIQHSGNT